MCLGLDSSDERWNGRLAMLGFIISIIAELIVGHSVLGNILY
ncbi:MAG: high light inducible protein [Synechococcaceae cyanobacterium SM2_3_1]|nr:high light inducible protein [Synechococcaceae cyanobacterium SM2_3_1]